MTLTIDDPEADRLADELARRTGETTREAVVKALRERLERVPEQRRPKEGLAEALLAIGRRASSLPVYDTRDPDDMLYDEHGLPC